MSDAELLVVDVYPSLSQSEGDHGNVMSLVARARARGLAAQSMVVHPGDEIPMADVFMLGGSPDLDLPHAAQELRRSSALAKAVDQGAVVLGVGAGYLLLSASFQDRSGAEHKGCGLLDVRMVNGRFAAGPVISKPDRARGWPALSGYEYHASRALRGPAATPFVALDVGEGDGAVDETGLRCDGSTQGKVIGTWLHGPLLPRNPEVADLILGWARPQWAQPTVVSDGVADLVRSARVAESRLKR